MGAGIAASPHCAERRICRCSLALVSPREGFNPASRSWLTSSGVASHPTAPSCEEPDRSTDGNPEDHRSFNPSSLTEVKTVRCSAALLGSITLASRFAFRTEMLPAASRFEEDRLFRRLFPAGPASTPERASALPAGGDRTFGHPPHPPAVAGSWGGRDRRPDHPVTMHMSHESQKRKMRERGCG
jgi:hypothetical protein